MLNNSLEDFSSLKSSTISLRKDTTQFGGIIIQATCGGNGNNNGAKLVLVWSLAINYGIVNDQAHFCVLTCVLTVYVHMATA